MPAVLNTNVASLWASKNLLGAQEKMANSVERLSSGLRINRARDDAAGMGISQTLASQINGANQGIRNINDGISMVQTAEGAISAATEMGQRILMLATQASNSTLGSAERASIKYKQAEWMEQQVGKQFKGVVSGMADFGIFVEIKEYKCEGMIRLSNIPGDHYEFDSYMMAVVGNRTHRQFKMGDEIDVIVSAASKIKRTIDLEIILETQNPSKIILSIK